MAGPYSWLGNPTLNRTVPLAGQFRQTAGQAPPPPQTTPADRAAAFGASPETEEARQARTGVDRGGSGYVSGQVQPTPPPMPVAQAPAAAPYTAPATPGYNPPVQVGNTGSGTRVPQESPTPVGLPPGGGTRVPVAAPAPAPTDDISTRTGALTAPQLGTAPTAGAGANTGTTQGRSPIPTGQNASPTVYGLNQISPGLGDSLDPGSNLLRPTMTDLTPTQQAQAAAFGASGDFSQERFDYRPGSAPAQDRVQLDTAKADELRARQFGSLDDLAAAARGDVASPAEIQLRQQAARNNAATFGAARALGGRSAGGAGRAATLASTDANIRTNADAGMMRATEQANARNALVSALSGVRGQDVDISQANANLGQAANANNLQSQTQANALAEQHRQALIEAQLQAMGIGTNAASATVAGSKANAETDNQLKGGIMKAIGSAFGM